MRAAVDSIKSAAVVMSGAGEEGSGLFGRPWSKQDAYQGSA
jgi:hypothetical protein